MKEDKSARALPEKLEREVSAAAMASTPNNAVNTATKLLTCFNFRCQWKVRHGKRMRGAC
jgi:hypothetical protein